MEMTKLTSVIVCDAGPIIHLDELGQLSLLVDFSKVFITKTVQKEVEKHRLIDLSDLPIEIVSTPVVDSQLSALATALCLHAGEISALSFARTKNDVIFLTDDAAARLAAGQMNLRVHGTIGILLRSIRRGLKSSEEIKTCLQSIPERSTLHVRMALIHRAIKELEKGYCEKVF
jgi:predicted nucleic acid-binding protein